MDVNIENVDGNYCDTIIQFDVSQSADTNEQTLVIKHARIDYQLDSIRPITRTSASIRICIVQSCYDWILWSILFVSIFDV